MKHFFAIYFSKIYFGFLLVFVIYEKAEREPAYTVAIANAVGKITERAYE